MVFRKSAEVVPPLSPARLLAASLTDPETRGEWRRVSDNAVTIGGHTARYRNDTRDLDVRRWACYGVHHSSTGIVAPFRLSKAEEAVVREALAAFDERQRVERETAALARLIASPIEARSDATPKSGAARRAKAGKDAQPPSGASNV
jgi:hypothetical protein